MPVKCRISAAVLAVLTILSGIIGGCFSKKPIADPAHETAFIIAEETVLPKGRRG